MDGFDAVNDYLNNHFDKIYLGFSGGLDSCVLLNLLSGHEGVQKKLRAIHINHGLSPHAHDWERWTKQICQDSTIAFQSFSVNLETQKNLEESARNARYQIFKSLLKSERDVLLLAHHQNDQAETLLLHLFRGAGIDGLSAMPEWRTLGKGQLYRPLLNISRKELASYAVEKKLTWIDDESNQNLHFNRNFLRHEVIPLLQTRWPGLVNNLSRSSKHCAFAREQIRQITEKLLLNIMDDKKRLNIQRLQEQSCDMQMNLLRLWLEKQAIKNIKKPDQNQLTRVLYELIPAVEDGNPSVEWKKWAIRRYQGWLYFTPRWFKIAQSEKKLDGIEIRYRTGGEKIKLAGKTRDLKKLFQLWKIPPWERNQIPLIYINNTLACVQGLATGDNFLEYFIENQLKY